MTSQAQPQTEEINADQVIGLLDKAIATLEFLKDMIPGKVDDLVLSFLKWGRNDPTLMDWLRSSQATPPNAMVAIPDVVTDAIRRWRVGGGGTEVQGASTGSWMELIGLVMQVFEWVKARRGAPTPTPAPPTT